MKTCHFDCFSPINRYCVVSHSFKSLSFVFRTLVLLCFGVDIYEFILYGFCRFRSVAKLANCQPLLFQTFSPNIFLLSFQDANDWDVKYCGVVLQVLESFIFFQCDYSLLFILSDFFLSVFKW